MHSFHRNSINTIEEWLSLKDEGDEEYTINLDQVSLGNNLYSPCPRTALLYGYETICQEEK